jgi:subtilisin family serine protease
MTISTTTTATAARTRLTAMAAALLLALAAIGVMPAAASSAGGVERVSVIVRLVDGANPDVEAAAAARSGASVAFVYRNVFPGFAAELPARAVAALARNPRVAFVERDGVVTTSTTSTAGTQTSATWGLDRIDQRARPLNGTFSYPSTAPGVRAYIVDTGVRASHVDFGGRVLPGYTAISDGRGTNDCDGHGTHVAGTVAGATWGVAKAAAIVPVRVLDCNGSGTWTGVIAGLDWIAQNHPTGTPGVANLSLGGGANRSVDDAVNRLSAAGVTVVVAAGNSNADACNTSPARAASAVTVGSTTSSDARSSFSNFGTCVDLFAPGSSITSAWYTSNTATAILSGTSMAAPHVAGAAALLLHASPGLTPAQVSAALTTDATTGVITSVGTGSPNRLLFVDSTPIQEAEPVEPAPLVDPAVTDIVTTQSNGGPWSRASTSVTVVDRAAPTTPLAGVTVEGTWYHNGAARDSASAVTGSDGVAVLDTQVRTRDLVITFRVTRLSGPTVNEKIYPSGGIESGESLDPIQNPGDGDEGTGDQPPVGDDPVGDDPVGDDPVGDDPVGDDPESGPIVVDVDGSSSVSLSNGRWLSGTASVLITSAAGPQPGVLVRGSWFLNDSLSPFDTVSGTTGSSGWVSLSHSSLRVGSGKLEFCVTSLSGDGIALKEFAPKALCLVAIR